MFEHQKKCNADEKKFFMPLVSNCESCFLRLCLVFLNQKDSDVHNVKIFSSEKWVQNYLRKPKKTYA